MSFIYPTFSLFSCLLSILRNGKIFSSRTLSLFHLQHFSYIAYTSHNFLLHTCEYITHEYQNCVYAAEHSPEHLCHTNACAYFEWFITRLRIKKKHKRTSVDARLQGNTFWNFVYSRNFHCLAKIPSLRKQTCTWHLNPSVLCPLAKLTYCNLTQLHITWQGTYMYTCSMLY